MKRKAKKRWFNKSRKIMDTVKGVRIVRIRSK